MATVTGLTNPELFPVYYERKLLQFVRQNLPVLNYFISHTVQMKPEITTSKII